jgi:hypothetical protein
MKPSQFHKLMDLVENIKKTDAMIRLHREKDYRYIRLGRIIGENVCYFELWNLQSNSKG